MPMIFIPTHPQIHSSSTQSTRRSQRKEQGGDVGFSGYMHEAEESDQPLLRATAPMSALAASNPLLGLQELSDDSFSVKQAIKHGHASLELLEEVRLSLMCGGIPLVMLHQLEAMVTQERQQQPNAELQEILDDIELRVVVERTKLEMALHQRDQ